MVHTLKTLLMVLREFGSPQRCSVARVSPHEGNKIVGEDNRVDALITRELCLIEKMITHAHLTCQTTFRLFSFTEGSENTPVGTDLVDEVCSHQCEDEDTVTQRADVYGPPPDAVGSEESRSLIRQDVPREPAVFGVRDDKLTA